MDSAEFLAFGLAFELVRTLAFISTFMLIVIIVTRLLSYSGYGRGYINPLLLGVLSSLQDVEYQTPKMG